VTTTIHKMDSDSARLTSGHFLPGGFEDYPLAFVSLWMPRAEIA